jgi:hypothetical protein
MRFANTLNKIVEIAQNHELVNTTVVAIANEERDLQKKNVFPMIHILPQEMLVENNSIVFSFEIAVLNDRDFSKTLERQKIGDNSNALQNIDTTAQILEDILGELQLIQTDDFFLEPVDPAQIIYLSGINIVDGVVTTVRVRVPKQVSIC